MTTPRLLVSVRNTREAIALLDSACAIVDVKEPSRGALGMADAAELQRIADTLPDHQTMSVALGEVTELAADPVVPKRAAFAKLGMSHLQGTDWEEAWQSARALLEGQSLNWVAVVYADHRTARSPEPELIVEAAARTNCVVVLVDTFGKRKGESVFDAMSVAELASLREQTNAAGMQFALAGQLRVHHAPEIADVEPNIVGIRGAACRAGDRRAEIDAELVDNFAAAIANNRVST